MILTIIHNCIQHNEQFNLMEEQDIFLLNVFQSNLIITLFHVNKNIIVRSEINAYSINPSSLFNMLQISTELNSSQNMHVNHAYSQNIKHSEKK